MGTGITAWNRTGYTYMNLPLILCETRISVFLLRKEEEDMNIQDMPVIDMRRTGLKITQLRKASGKSVRELQDIFGFGTPQAIYKWQQGVSLPTIDNLIVLSVIFGVSLDEIIVLEDAYQIKTA